MKHFRTEGDPYNVEINCDAQSNIQSFENSENEWSA